MDARLPLKVWDERIVGVVSDEALALLVPLGMLLSFGHIRHRVQVHAGVHVASVLELKGLLDTLDPGEEGLIAVGVALSPAQKLAKALGTYLLRHSSA